MTRPSHPKAPIGLSSITTGAMTDKSFIRPPACLEKATLRMSLRDVRTVRLKLNMVLTYGKYGLNTPPRGGMGHLPGWWVEFSSCYWLLSDYFTFLSVFFLTLHLISALDVMENVII